MVEALLGWRASEPSKPIKRCVRQSLSEASADSIERAHKVHPITAVQTEYSLWTRDPEDGVLGACRKLGIG